MKTVIVPLDFIDSLISCDADIVAADVIIRGYPFNHMSFVSDGNQGLVPIPDMALEIEKQGIGPVINVGAVGFSLCLIKVDILRKMADPWFVTGPMNTEDIYFCLKAKQLKDDITIKLDSRVQCGHILWQEVISRGNKANYSLYQEAMNPGMLEERLRQDGENRKTGKGGDRNVEYLNMVKGLDFIEEGDSDEA